MADLHIKPDPDTKGASPAAFSEQDLYEDAGDLEFNDNPAWQSLYLARIPKHVWEAWSTLDEDAEIQIGTVRATTISNADGTSGQKLSMLLRSDIAAHQGIAKEYDFDIMNQGSETRNTFLFSEQDLPGYISKSRQKFDPTTANMPLRLQRAKQDKNRAPYDANKKWTPFVKKPVPKRTIIAGKVKTEVNVVEVDNEESRRLLELRTLDFLKPKRTTKFILEDTNTIGSAYVHPGTVASQKKYEGFIRTKGTGASRPQLSKATRIPFNVLLDKLFVCFKKYNYWSLKALRAELRQPEAYLREALEKIAVLAKSGRFNAHWSLKPEHGNYLAGDSVAPAADVEEESDDDMNGEDDDDDDDEDVKFEDV